MFAAILGGYGFERRGRPAARQWELMAGACIGIGFMFLLRYGDVVRCRWGEGFCDVFPTHIRFYLDDRENSQYGGNYLDIARPEDPRQGWDPEINSEDGPNPVTSLLEHTPLPSALMTTRNQDRALHEIWRPGSFALR